MLAHIFTRGHDHGAGKNVRFQQTHRNSKPLNVKYSLSIVSEQSQWGPGEPTCSQVHGYRMSRLSDEGALFPWGAFTSTTDGFSCTDTSKPRFLTTRLMICTRLVSRIHRLMSTGSRHFFLASRQSWNTVTNRHHLNTSPRASPEIIIQRPGSKARYHCYFLTCTSNNPKRTNDHNDTRRS